MEKKYRIEIKKIEAYEDVASDWKKTADTGNPKDGGSVYEYVKYPVMRNRESTELLMELDELDLKKVVSALILNQ